MRTLRWSGAAVVVYPIAALALSAACQGRQDTGTSSGDQDTPDESADAAAPPPGDDGGHGGDAAPTTGDPPALTCDPEDTGARDLCRCMARIVCDQIYHCLDAEEIAARPEYWSPHARCVDELVEDCFEDLASDPDEYLPADFPACVRDLGTATCDDFGDFASVSGDFPASCENLRALDTALGIAQ